MSRWRRQLLSFALLPAILIAAGVLGYYSWQTATQYAQLGEQTIGESTLLLVREKVDVIEQFVINQDNAIFRLVNLSAPEQLEEAWNAAPPDSWPSARALLVLDDSGTPLAFAMRGTERERREVLKVFLERIVPDLELERQQVGRLKHLHRTYGGTNYLVSYKVLRHRGRRRYLVAYHDPAYIVREEFPRLFATEEGKRLYNVVDEDNRRVYGPSLAQAGDYLVGHRFPTTLYGWRLQVAPKQAPRLEAQARSRRLTEVGLIGTSLLVILLGVAFLLYAAGKERRLNALKSEFLANVSHELKTPLSVVRMFGELLLTKRVQNPDKQQQYLEIICLESERLSSLIENVLDFAAVERGKRTYDLREGDLREAVARAVDAFRYRVEREGTEVTIEHQGEILPVRLDEQAMVLAVINLLDNAVKYGEGSPVSVTIEARGKRVELRVRDHGPGIPSEDLKRVFDRFYRSRREGASRGSGIGLSLVKHIAEAHHGKAWAENAPDGGAIVALSLPVAAAAPRQRKDTTGSGRTSSATDAVAAEE